jgi:hypothetical protein
MKKLILSICIVFLTTIVFSQSFNWGKTFGGNNNETITGCATDEEANIYLTGYFRDTVDFDPGSGVFNLISNGPSDDVFIVKLDSSGQFLWAKNFGGTSTDAAFAITTYENEIFITGTFLTAIQFSSFSLTQNGSGTASFVCKLDSAGTVIWANAIKNQSGGTIRSQAITTNKDGDVYTTGYFNGTIEDNSTLYPYAGTLSGFIYKVDNNGTNSSIQTLLGDVIECRSIAVDNDKNIYVCGIHAGDNDFDPGMNTMLASSINFSRDIFVLKLSNTSGNSWVRSIGIDGTEHANALVVDDSSNVYFTGSIRDTVDFSEDSSVILIAGSQRNSYVAKLNAEGLTQWAHLIGNSNNQNSGQGLAIDIDNKGEIYLGGNFGGKIDFDFGVDTFFMSTVFGGDDVFILKLSPNADFLWARRIGGDNQSDKIGGIAVQNENNFYVAGTFVGTTKLDPMGGSSPIFGNSTSSDDVFVVRYSSDLLVSVTNQKNIESKIFLYPNPSNAEVFILNQTNQPIKSVVVYDMVGRILFEQKENKSRIDFSKLPSGLYNLEIITADETRTMKLLQKN